MKTVKYAPKNIAKPFLDALAAKFSKLKPATQKAIQEQVLSGKMHLLVAHDGDKLKGGMVVQGKKTEQGPTAFIYGIFGTSIADPEYYDQAVKILKMAGFLYIQGFGQPAILRTYKQAGLPFKETRKTENGVFFGAPL